MLFAQYGLGMAVNLWVEVPRADEHRGFIGAFRTIVHRPAAIAMHVVLGTMLIVAAVTVSIRAWRLRNKASVAATFLGLAFIVGAWSSGTEFVDHGRNYSSFLMAILSGLAAGCYLATALVAARLERLDHDPAGRPGGAAQAESRASMHTP